ncbi:hypothetical protein MUP01_12050 [Candidatus Bathyarchaeota archaeon]|nr:hypothetical protein [Candidatus Bathyarchaeota archaeon]
MGDDRGFLSRSDCLAAALQEIDRLDSQGVRAKIWAPLPEHEGSGHVHIVVLTTFHEKLSLAGITVKGEGEAPLE